MFLNEKHDAYISSCGSTEGIVVSLITIVCYHVFSIILQLWLKLMMVSADLFSKEVIVSGKLRMQQFNTMVNLVICCFAYVICLRMRMLVRDC